MTQQELLSLEDATVYMTDVFFQNASHTNRAPAEIYASCEAAVAAAKEIFFARLADLKAEIGLKGRVVFEQSADGAEDAEDADFPGTYEVGIYHIDLGGQVSRLEARVYAKHINLR